MKKIILFLAIFVDILYAQKPSSRLANSNILGVTNSFSLPQGYNSVGRTFTYHLPPNVSCNLPLLIVFHGDGGTGDGIRQVTGFDGIADANNFVVVYPDAAINAAFWNSKIFSYRFDNPSNANDDLAFVDDLIAYFYEHYGINRNKVYATGHSSGGNMAFLVGVKRSDKIAAIAPVSGLVQDWSGGNNFLTALTNAQKIPLLHIHGTADTNSGVDFPVLPYPPSSPPAYVWAESEFSQKNCGTQNYSSLSNWNNTQTDKLTFCDNTADKEVILLAVKGLGHAWPTLASSGQINASQVIWDFVKQYELNTFIAVKPIINTNKQTINAGESVSLSASGCGTLTYVWSTGESASGIVVSPQVTTNYTVQCQSKSSQCQVGNTSLEQTITVNSSCITPNMPALSANPVNISSGASSTLSASGCVAPNIVTWSDNLGTGLTKIVSPTQTKTYYATCSSGSCVSQNASIQVNVNQNNLPEFDSHIKIDQFGYRLNDKKIAVISKASIGFNAPDSFLPSTGNLKYEVKRVADNVSVFWGTLQQWGNGAVHSNSGDYAWWFDFSGLKTPGNYYIYDAGLNIKSYHFTIHEEVYANLGVKAVKALYFQRCGVAKAETYSGLRHDGACHLNSEQDLDCRAASNPVVSTSENLSGGWHDAGDYNKYVNFAYPAVHDLIYAYLEKPNYWGDDSNIPESGNSLPDILDELKVETDWLLKMQLSDGSVLSKVSVMSYNETSPASASMVARRYAPANTTSSLTFASMLSHAASVYQMFPSTYTYAQTLKNAAINAFNWAISHPNVTFSNAGYASADVDGLLGSYDRNYALKVSAAVYLYKLTGLDVYKTIVESNYMNLHLVQWNYAYEYETTYQDALLEYATLPGVNATVANAIISAYKSSIDSGNDNLPNFLAKNDAYRAFMGNYTFNSNHFVSYKALLFQNAIKYSLGFLNYLHGVNPLNKVYLSNMGEEGAENSVSQIYHVWFGDGTVYDGLATGKIGPPPGFLVCGADQSYVADGGNASLSPPANQPKEKSYLDFNTAADASWVNSEVAIYNQATYARLVEKFIKFNYSRNNISYCIPNTTSGSLYINSLVLDGNSLSVNSGWQEGGYSLVNTRPMKIVKGVASSCTLSVNQLDTYVKSIWIDLNHDGDFNDIGELISSVSVGTLASSSSINIPNNALDGVTRLRIRISKNTLSACDDNLSTGETEDYPIEIVTQACTVLQNPTLVNANPSVVSLGGTTTLSASGCASNLTYLWTAPDIANPTPNILSTSASFVTTTISMTTVYTVYCVDGTCKSSGKEIQVMVSEGNCLDSVVLTDSDNVNTGVFVKQAKSISGKITAMNKITGNVVSSYSAAAITLSPGFLADSGVVFKAEVGGCN